MPEPLGYQNLGNRKLEIAIRRARIVRRVRIALIAVALSVILFVIAFAIFWQRSEIRSHYQTVTITVTNSTTRPVEQAGWVDPMNGWVVTTGPIAAGATACVTQEYNIDEIPAGFAFVRGGRLYRVDTCATAYELVETTGGQVRDRHSGDFFQLAKSDLTTRP